MHGTDTRSRIGVIVETLSEGARTRQVPAGVVEEARRACLGRFSGSASVSASRVEAYFWGVVRRRALQGAAPALGRWMLVSSAAGELAAAGHAPADVYLELRRLYGDVVEASVVERFRPGLPAHAA